MNNPIIKVCGLRDGENISQVIDAGADWTGMIFWNHSPRNVTMVPTHAGILPDRAPDATGIGPAKREVKRVGVFVDEMAQNIITRVVQFQLDMVQLHGHESPTLLRNLRRTIDPDIRPGLKIIKTISIASPADIESWHTYADCADYFLFDTKCDTVGGSGRQFNWDVLSAYDGDIPFILSGGIGPDDADRVKAFHHKQCVGIDLNSRFETEPGLKDADALRAFIQKVKPS